MRGVIIRDGVKQNHLLNFDLRDILYVLGERGVKSNWLCNVAEYVSIDYQEIEIIVNANVNNVFIKGQELIDATKNLVQVIEGEFKAFDESSNNPWVIVHAVDSSYWEVFSDDSSIFEAIKSRFSAVEETTDSSLHSE